MALKHNRTLTSFAAIAATLLFLGALAACNGRGAAKRPTLLVVIAVDQLRADLLDRYDSLFKGGFRRLRDRGMRYDRTMVDHAITISHPGHVTLATGMHPAHHGIVDAAFYEKKDGQRVLVDSLQDPAEKIVGAPEQKGVSPRKILVTTLGEWVAAENPEARVVAIGAGQYSSLLHAGRQRTHVYWYSGGAGRFVTSSYYRDAYPEWVNRFNNEEIPKFLNESEVWDCRVPAEARALAVPDDSRFEADREHVTFPHRLADVMPADALAQPEIRMRGLAQWVATTPVLDDATLALAREAVKAEALGQREPTDLLSIVVSSVDDIGHWYGPLSLEQLDNLLRLDAELGELFDYLDTTVGKDKYVVALSADHGAPNPVEHTLASGGKARLVSEAEIEAILADQRAAAAEGGSEAEIEARVAAAAERHEVVADAMTSADFEGAGSGDPHLALYRNSWRTDRVPRFPIFSFSGNGEASGRYGVAIRLTENALIALDPSVHGSPYDYDRHVPLVFMGAGVEAGNSQEPARTVDLAPTLAAFADVAVPAGIDGRNLQAR